MSGDRRVVGSTPPRAPMIVWPLTLAVLIGAVGGIWGAADGQVRVLVPKTDLPAGERLTAAQVERRYVWARGLDTAVVKPPMDLTGRVTREALVKGRPIPARALTSRPVAVGIVLHLTPAKASVEAVAVGDPVLLRFAPTAADPALKPVTVPAVLLRAPVAKATDLVVSVAATDVDAVLGAAGRGHVFVTPQ